MEIRQNHTQETPGGKNTMIPQMVTHGTPRTATDGDEKPQKLDASYPQRFTQRQFHEMNPQMSCI